MSLERCTICGWRGHSALNCHTNSHGRTVQNLRKRHCNEPVQNQPPLKKPRILKCFNCGQNRHSLKNCFHPLHRPFKYAPICNHWTSRGHCNYPNCIFQHPGRDTQQSPMNSVSLYQQSPMNSVSLYQQSPMNSVSLYQQSPMNSVSLYQQSPMNTFSLYQQSPMNNLSSLYRQSTKNPSIHITINKSYNHNHYDESTKTQNITNNVDNRRTKYKFITNKYKEYYAKADQIQQKLFPAKYQQKQSVITKMRQPMDEPTNNCKIKPKLKDKPTN